MSRSLNRVTLIGHVGGDPDVRTVTNGSRVATLSLATSESWTNDAGQANEKTEWHRLVVWNKGKRTLADFVEQYIKKGEKLYVEGKVTYRQWEDKEGVKRTAAEIMVSELMPLSGRRDQDVGAPAARTTTPAATPETSPAKKAAASASDFPDALLDDDDDLPF
jgi:single-strand DNA-binding protein